jgi:hypothetical protein
MPPPIYVSSVRQRIVILCKGEGDLRENLMRRAG